MGILSVVFILLSVKGNDKISNRNHPRQISVWDNVLSADNCQVLHEFASGVGLSHHIFTRNNNEPMSKLEHVLDSILEEVGDDSNTVEYWCRQEWKSIEAHADVDERLAIEEESFRYPQNGHVLYLQVGSEVRGPTCVFPQCSFGGDLVDDDHYEDGKVDLITVPAVEGRLLRFEGSYLHAVPRPADLWLLPFTQMGPREPEKEWGRSVVLFNTWPDNPPLCVEPSTSAKSVGKSSTCTPMSEWNHVAIDDRTAAFDENTETKKCKIWLLGNASRRAYANRNVQMRADNGLKDTLEQPHQPMLSWLSIE